MAHSTDDKKDGKKPYQFGGINDFNLEEIENEVLNDSVYLDVFAGSDIRFKEDIYPLENSLENINKIQAFKYHYKTSEFPEKNFSQEEQTGVMAQELEKVVPLAVKTDETGYKYVNYAHLAPMLIEAVKELSAKVDEQATKIEELESKLKCE
jgi:hypothetical protein